MPSLNRVTLVGNISRDPELRRIPGGSAVCDFTVAITRKKGREGGEETAFIDCTAWAKTAEFVAAELKKGSTILVEGRLTQDRWQDKQTGQNRYKLKVTAESIQALGAGPVPGGSTGVPVEKNLDDVQF